MPEEVKFKKQLIKYKIQLEQLDKIIEYSISQRWTLVRKIAKIEKKEPIK